MKVKCVYILGFHRPDERMQETKSVVSALCRRYEAREGVMVHVATLDTNKPPLNKLRKMGGTHVVKRVLDKDNPNKKGWSDCFDMDDWSGCFGPDEEPTDYGTGPGKGVGVYFVFHGDLLKTDEPAVVLSQLIGLLMDKHPKGQLRKVVVLACAYAHGNNDSHLDHFVTLLQKEHSKRLADLPKLIAGWMQYITVNDIGKKIAASLKSNDYKPAKECAAQFKVYYLFNEGQYVRKQISGSNDPIWHDPDVYTSSDGYNVTLGGDSSFEVLLNDSVV